MKVAVVEREVAKFKEYCKAGFPYERFGVLLGVMSEDKWNFMVSRIWMPDEDSTKKWCKKDRVYVPDEWWAEAQDEAEEHELMVVGDVHSHCFEGPSDGVRSERDLRYSQWWAIEGVVVVWPTRTRLVSRVRWWGPIVPLDAYSL